MKKFTIPIFDLLDTVIERKRDALGKGKKKALDISEKLRQLDLLDRLLECNSEQEQLFTDKEIRDEMFAFFAGLKISNLTNL